jgi:hypothetical protein
MKTLDPELPGEGFLSVPVVWSVFYVIAIVGTFAAAPQSGARDQAVRSAKAEIDIRPSFAHESASSTRLAARLHAPVRHLGAIRR